MNKEEVSRILKTLGDLLEISDANSFEVMAYRNASRTLDAWDGDLESAATEGSLTELEGIGKGLAAIITELVQHGRSQEHERVLDLFPPGLPELLTLPGIGPKKIKALWSELGIDSLDALETATRGGRVSTLRGFGKKTEERILASIERRRRGTKFAPSTSLRKTAARTVSSGRLSAGTSGYSYPEWRGAFYPDELPTTRFLEYYAARFATVEINNTFYRFPSQKTLEGWASVTPDDFQFAVKANQRITHRLRLRNATEVTTSFVERCRILGSRLGPILFQLPPTLRRDDALLSEFVNSLPEDGRYTMEFRHESWFDDTTWTTLRDRQVGLVVQDDEKLSSPKTITSDFAYVRLRRAEYDPVSLASWETWFEELRKNRHDVFVYLKHDEGGQTPEAILGPWLPATPSSHKRHAPSTRRRGTGSRRDERSA